MKKTSVDEVTAEVAGLGFEEKTFKVERRVSRRGNRKVWYFAVLAEAKTLRKVKSKWHALKQGWSLKDPDTTSTKQNHFLSRSAQPKNPPYHSLTHTHPPSLTHTHPPSLAHTQHPSLTHTHPPSLTHTHPPSFTHTHHPSASHIPPTPYIVPHHPMIYVPPPKITLIPYPQQTASKQQGMIHPQPQHHHWGLNNHLHCQTPVLPLPALLQTPPTQVGYGMKGLPQHPWWVPRA